MVSLPRLYRQLYAVRCETEAELTAFLDMVRNDEYRPEEFSDYWIEDDFHPDCPTCVTVCDRSFNFSEEEWWINNYYTVVPVSEVLSGYPFAVGDRVVSVVNCNEGNTQINVGSTGTIVALEFQNNYGLPPVGVLWDDITSGHACNGTIRELEDANKGYWVNIESLALELEREFANADFAELFG